MSAVVFPLHAAAAARSRPAYRPVVGGAAVYHLAQRRSLREWEREETFRQRLAAHDRQQRRERSKSERQGRGLVGHCRMGLYGLLRRLGLR